MSAVVASVYHMDGRRTFSLDPAITVPASRPASRPSKQFALPLPSCHIPHNTHLHLIAAHQVQPQYRICAPDHECLHVAVSYHSKALSLRAGVLGRASSSMIPARRSLSSRAGPLQRAIGALSFLHIGRGDVSSSQTNDQGAELHDCGSG